MAPMDEDVLGMRLVPYGSIRHCGVDRSSSPKQLIHQQPFAGIVSFKACFGG